MVWGSVVIINQFRKWKSEINKFGMHARQIVGAAVPVRSLAAGAKIVVMFDNFNLRSDIRRKA